MRDVGNSSRIEVVDALRGFALLAIVLLHNLEHYNLYYFPENFPQWLKTLDKGVWDTTFFLLAGKAFSTFSLLFGFSFFIQLRNQERKGKNFRWRFAWRMVVLMAFAQLHALFYNGDILLMYAVVGLLLIPVSKLPDKWVWGLGLFLLLQPFEWGRMIYAWLDPEFTLSGNLFLPYALEAKEVMENGNFADILRSNMTDGMLYNNLWQIENGRLFQIPALFMFGMMLGKMQYFVDSPSARSFWKKVLISASCAFVPLFLLRTYVPSLIVNPAIKIPFEIAVPSLSNFSFMCVLVAGFVLCWFYKGNGYKFQRFIIPYGRMSLTNYILQSIIGCALYLNWGLGWYEHTGATYTILIGLCIFGIQYGYSSWWLSRFRQGPFEWVWKKLTWIGK